MIAVVGRMVLRGKDPHHGDTVAVEGGGNKQVHESIRNVMLWLDVMKYYLSTNLKI